MSLFISFTISLSIFWNNGDEIDEVDNHCHLGKTFQSTAT
jgi:hypothetical protein